MRFLDDRAPLDATKPSSKNKTFVCPHCKTGNVFTKNWFAGNCRACKEYFNADNSLPLEEQTGESISAATRTLDEGFIKLKGQMETRAYNWKDKLENDGHPGYDFGHVDVRDFQE
jgi:hypothetical protein